MAKDPADSAQAINVPMPKARNLFRITAGDASLNLIRMPKGYDAFVKVT